MALTSHLLLAPAVAAVEAVAWAAELCEQARPVDTDADARLMHAIFSGAHRPRFANPSYERQVVGRLAFAARRPRD